MKLFKKKIKPIKLEIGCVYLIGEKAYYVKPHALEMLPVYRPNLKESKDA